MSPKRKKTKVSSNEEGEMKLTNEKNVDDQNKPHNSENCLSEEELRALKRKNFVKACEQVSYKEYYNYAKRFKLVYLPQCINGSNCNHKNVKNSPNINQIPSYAEESFHIEIKSGTWCEALEVCFICLTPDQYLSANILKNIVEIMLNAHDDPDEDFTVSYLLEKCQQVLSQQFSTHPPCLMKTIRKCYIDFLTSSMDRKDNTFTNRDKFEYNKGVVKYCMNRLEYELSLESNDEPLVNEYEITPEEMKDSVKGLHWQKQKLELYETLKREDRINRIMAVLESVIELLQFDLVIWLSRYNNNTGCHIMRSHRPLMAFVLWSDNILFTGAVNNNCRQILRIFSYMVHLSYPEEHIRIMTMWLNSIIQTFYICENNSNSDYPNTGKYCNAFAKEFYKIISGLPRESVLKILQRVQPTYMQNILGTLHLQSTIPTTKDNIIEIVIEFLENSQWTKYPTSNIDLEMFLDNSIKIRKVKSMSNYLSKILHKIHKENLPVSKSFNQYPKFDPNFLKDASLIDQSYVVFALYITLNACLDAYSVQHVQNVLDSLNENLTQGSHIDKSQPSSEFCTYNVTVPFIKHYRSIYTLLKELIINFNKVKNNGTLPSSFKVFKKIDFLAPLVNFS
ncbi:hypothetical protein RR46_08568 [Papilio xuthus]|uniref:Uncharacterized protein n=1 Tax=Papilio xuthus TaxID=66420 RepID=A0A194QDJ6_PAPXU|nr:hypothetical protein RR46_08568 [Papilio xuthus]